MFCDFGAISLIAVDLGMGHRLRWLHLAILLLRRQAKLTNSLASQGPNPQKQALMTRSSSLNVHAHSPYHMRGWSRRDTNGLERRGSTDSTRPRAIHLVSGRALEPWLLLRIILDICTVPRAGFPSLRS